MAISGHQVIGTCTICELRCAIWTNHKSLTKGELSTLLVAFSPYSQLKYICAYSHFEAEYFQHVTLTLDFQHSGQILSFLRHSDVVVATFIV